MSRLLIVANRLPVTVRLTPGGVEVERSTGGLATGLLPPPRAVRRALDRLVRGGGRSQPRAASAARGSALLPAPRRGAAQRGPRHPLLRGLLQRGALAAVSLPARPGPAAGQRLGRLRAGQRAVRRGGGGAVPARRPGLGARLPAPAAARAAPRRLPEARIGFFLHIPFPSEEVFRTLPWRRAAPRGPARRGPDRLSHPHLPPPLRHALSPTSWASPWTSTGCSSPRPRGAARRLPDGRGREPVRDARARPRGRGRGGGAPRRWQRCGSWWASTGSTTPRASRGGCSRSSGCSRLTPSCGRRCAWSRWRCPRAPGSRPTRTSAR